MATGLETREVQHGLDESKREALAERLMAMFNAGGLILMTSIGHRTGLFDTMAKMSSASSQAIAQRAGLQERYVREWLGAMVTGGVVDYDPEHQTYSLPAEHASLLTRAAAPDNFAGMMQWFAVLGQVEDKIVDCFRHGGGVHYGSYCRFHQVMAEESAQTVVAALIEHILPLVPGSTERLTAGIDVLDVGCGAGRALHRMAESYPRSRFAGYDFESEAIEMARADADRRGLHNVHFEVVDVARMEEASAFDLITAFDAIHDQADPAAVLRSIHAALRPDGTFLMQDIDASSYLQNNRKHPLGSFLYSISCMHCMSVSLAQGGAGLGTCWGEELARKMLREAGFSQVAVERLPHDFQNAYFIAKK